jgi:hypothetical protein
MNEEAASKTLPMPLIAFFDIEANPAQKQILDIGAVLPDGSTIYKKGLNS